MDGQKAQLDKEQTGGRMMIIVKVPERSVHYGRSRNWETQVRRSIYKQRSRLRGLSEEKGKALLNVMWKNDQKSG